jgi:hypothetical protein
MQTKVFACFGYGSLVNRQTLRGEVIACVPAKLRGWRRHWQSRGADIEPAAGEPIALLSVHRHETSEIDGMLIVARHEELPALDRREARYERVRLDPSQVATAGRDSGHALPDDVFVYVGLPQPQEREPAMLLQSYLDAVLAGFLAEYGQAGLDRFFASTTGFARPLIEDRHSPRYPRAIRLAPEIAAEFDRRLSAAGARARARISA